MTLSIHVSRFWTNYKPDPNDAAKLIPHDMCAYGAPGAAQRSVVITEVKRLSQVHPADDTSNPAVSMARMRWDAIKPQYMAWKAGQEPPVEGTPLAAWNAVTPEQAEVFKSRGIRTVEQVRDMTDAVIEGIPVPFVRELKRNAQRFLDSAEATRFAKVLADKDRALEDLQTQHADQAAQIAALMGKVEELAGLVAAKAETETKPDGKAAKKANAA